MTIGNEIKSPLPAPTAIAADYLSKSISISYLLKLIWSGRGIVAIAAAIGLLYGVYTVYAAGPSYTATIRVSPAPGSEGLNSSSGAGGLLASLTGESGATQVPKFIQFTYALGSIEVAEILDKKYGLLCRVYHADCDVRTHQWRTRTGLQEWIVGTTSRLSGLPDPNVGPRPISDLARYVTNSVVVEQLKKTDSVLTISYVQHNPQFASQFLSELTKTTNDYIRTQNRHTQEQYVAYLTHSAAQTTNVEQRQAIDNLLLQEERQLMMTEVDVPYAAQILDGPTVTPVNHVLKTIAIYIAIGLALGIAVAMSRDLLPRRLRVW